MREYIDIFLTWYAILWAATCFVLYQGKVEGNAIASKWEKRAFGWGGIFLVTLSFVRCFIIGSY